MQNYPEFDGNSPALECLECDEHTTSQEKCYPGECGQHSGIVVEVIHRCVKMSLVRPESRGADRWGECPESIEDCPEIRAGNNQEAENGKN